MKVKLDLSNYAAKADLKGVSGVDNLRWHQKQTWPA